MLNSTNERDKANSRSVPKTGTRWCTKQRSVSLAFLLVIYTTPCYGIGSWRKKTSAADAEEINTSNTSISGSGSNVNHNIDPDMDKTYLDLFGESAKEFLTHTAPEKIKSIFPKTDEACRWDWRYARCEPYCECSFQPTLPGDFHLGRACRKRSHIGWRTEDEVGSNETESNHFERNGDKRYHEHCTLERNPDEESGDEFVVRQRSSPPPPSIPSPFPVLAKSGKATWKILRSKTDPVVTRAVDEFETVHGRVQAVVCRDLKTRCDDGEESGDGNPSTNLEVAWQERLFCRDLVRECRGNASGLNQNDTD